jgi:DNA uptake protein ComE-like DNA-binding protein
VQFWPSSITRLALAALTAAALGLPVYAQTPTPGSAPAAKSAPPSTSSPAKPAAAPSASTAAAPDSKLVDLNTATPEQLTTLPGIGKVRAEAIVKHRPYKGKDDLVQKKIIPQNVYDGIKGKVIARQG